MEHTELKVLLIEDNPGDAFLIKFYLGESIAPKYDFYHAENIQSAYELLNQNTFDIILMDLNLPDSTGLETIKQMLERFPNNLVIVLTGLVDERVGLETVRYGAQDFLVKGKFDGKVLISSIMFAFERYNLNKALSKGEQRLSRLQEVIGAGYWETDLATGDTYVSPHLYKMLGLSPQSKITLDDTILACRDADTLRELFMTTLERDEVREATYTHHNCQDKPLIIRWKQGLTGKIKGAVLPK
jgi:DNA-binding response OmpR family regulator